MTVKEQLERIWNSPGCLCPSHRVWWCHPMNGGWWIHGFCFRRGRLVQLKGLPRKKGYSWLSKNYLLFYLHSFPRYPPTAE